MTKHTKDKRLTPTISCILTLHREGLTSHQTLQALKRSADYAIENAVSTEIVVIVDRPDSVTKEFLAYRWSNLAIKEVDYGDPARSRNYGVSIAQGAYIAICDGDDLFGRNWLFEAYKLAASRDRIIVHPEYNVCFDRAKIIYKHLDQETTKFMSAGLAFENYWTALSFAHRTTYEKCPYRATDKRLGYGFEDWHWNLEAIAKGYVHKVADGTVHFIRLKRSGSRNQMAAAEHLLMPDTSFFGSDIFLRGSHAELDTLKKIDR